MTEEQKEKRRGYQAKYREEVKSQTSPQKIKSQTSPNKRRTKSETTN